MPGRRDACLRCGRPLDANGDARSRVCVACRRTSRLELEPLVPSDLPEPEPAIQIEGLVLVRPLGSGGMGQVYVARDAVLDREVAVKFLRRDLMENESARRKFLREGRALARVQSPYVVRVFGVGEWRNRPYLTMELVEGRSLRDRIASGVLEEGEAFRLAEELALALCAAHERKIVHRDVNPSNVVLRHADGSACLIDFGVARDLGHATASSASHPAGTPHYMAPETLAGRAGDSRSDVWSFGVTLFESLTGVMPRGNLDYPGLRQTAVEEDFPLLRSVRPESSRAFEVLLARCLTRSAELRPADGSALLAAVRAARGGAAAGPAAHPESAPGRSPSKDPAPWSPDGPFPFLGRDAEIRTAEEALAHLDTRRGRILLVEGEAGAGRARFLRELEERARSRGMEVLRCRAEAGDGDPYRPWRAMLEEYAARTGLDSPDALLRRAVEATPENRALTPAMAWFLRPAFGPGHDVPSRLILSAGLEGLVRAVVKERPGLLSVSRAECLDEGSLDLLATLAERAASLPLAVAIGHRPVGCADRGPAYAEWLGRMRGAAHAVVVRLGPLPEHAVASLLQLALGADEAEARRIAPAFHARTGGNALHVVEALRLLRSEAGEVRGTGAWLRERVTSLPVPVHLQAVAARRVAALPEAEREALCVAAVDPEGVSSGLVARCLDLGPLAALRLLQRLARQRGLLREEGDRYVLGHAEIRDAVYGEMLPELRQGYHAEAARLLMDAGAAAEDPGRLARHLARGGKGREACRHFIEAGSRSLLAFAPLRALACFDEALAGGDPDSALEARLGRAEALDQAGEAERAREEFHRAIAGAHSRALLRYAAFERNHARDPVALEALGRIDVGGLAPRDRLAYHTARASVLSRLGRFPEAMAALEEGAPLASSVGPEQLRVEYENVRGAVLWRLGRHEEARACFERSVAHSDEIGFPDMAAAALYNLSLVAEDSGHLEEAMRRAQESVSRAALVGSGRTLAFARLQLADLQLRALRLEDADRTLSLVESSTGARSGDDLERHRLAHRCEAHLARGEPGDAVAAAWKGVGVSGSSPREEAEFRVLLGRALLLSGAAADALAEFRRAAEGLRRLELEAPAWEATAWACRALRTLREDGPERRAIRDLGEARSVVVAIEAALEAATRSERRKWTEKARVLATDPRSKEEVRASLGE